MYKIVHLGVGNLAYGVLQGLLDSEHDVVGVLYWDAQEAQSLRRRVKRMLVRDIHSLVENAQLASLVHQRASSPGFVEELQQLNPDILIVSGWGEILTEEVIAIPRIACINVHPALLPAHRGSNPMSSVLRENESVTGVTFHHMTSKIDDGDIICQAEIPLSAKDDGHTLPRKIAFKAKELVATTLERIADTQFVATPQTTAEASYFPRVPNHPVDIDWSMPAEDIEHAVRGYSAWVPCFFRHHTQRLHILSAHGYPLSQPCDTPGRVLDKLGTCLLVATGDPNTALFIDKAELSGLIGKIKSKYYIASHIKVGNILK